jgi:hypothetical protein
VAVVQAVAVALIGLFGVLVGALLTTRRENSRIRRELSLERYRDGQRLFDELIILAGERFTAMQRWLWSIIEPDRYSASTPRDDYFTTVRRWNSLTWSYRARLRILISQTTAVRFLDYADDIRPSNPASLHYQFVQAHNAILDCENGTGDARYAQSLLNQLNWAWSDFADDIAADLLQRARDLQLLREPGDLTSVHSTERQASAKVRQPEPPKRE